jgi:hypothetical protein
MTQGVLVMVTERRLVHHGRVGSKVHRSLIPEGTLSASCHWRGPHKIRSIYHIMAAPGSRHDPVNRRRSEKVKRNGRIGTHRDGARPQKLEITSYSGTPYFCQSSCSRTNGFCHGDWCCSLSNISFAIWLERSGAAQLRCSVASSAVAQTRLLSSDL